MFKSYVTSIKKMFIFEHLSFSFSEMKTLSNKVVNNFHLEVSFLDVLLLRILKFRQKMTKLMKKVL